MNKQYKVARHNLFFPHNHKLEQYQNTWKLYDRILGIIVKYVFLKYPDTTAIDIGANVGDTAALIQEFQPIPTLCIEGNPEYFSFLERNAQIIGNIEIAYCFIGEDGETVDLEKIFSQNGTTSISNALGKSGENISIMQSLASVIEEFSPFKNSKILKIDTDGLDLEIIRMSKDVIGNLKPVVYFEYDISFNFKNNSLHDAINILNFLGDLGYRRFMIFDNFGNHISSLCDYDQEHFFDLTNYLFSNLYKSGQPAVYYFDICAFHAEDIDIFQNVYDHVNETISQETPNVYDNVNETILQETSVESVEKCKICNSDSHYFANAKILQKYDVKYFQCSNCGFVQTEHPYWLDQAYSEVIATSDIGLVYRNNMMANITGKLLFNYFDHQAKFLDYGGGYGLFVRLMRDKGFDFHWFDKFCKNIFAKGFELQKTDKQNLELITAFELFEHLANPLQELKEIIDLCPNILFSTELLPENNPTPDKWWYYAPHEGQHIAIYTIKSLEILASKHNRKLYTNGQSLHLLTTKENLPENLFESLAKHELQSPNKESLLYSDFNQILNNILLNTRELNVSELVSIEPKEPIIIIDAVFFQLYQTGIARVWQSLLEQWANTEFANHILVLDRANTAPKINGIRYRTISAYNYNNTEVDKQMLQDICYEESAELFISTYYTTPIETPSVFMAYDMIPEVLGGDLNEPMWREKHYAIKHASAYISISENTAKDLNKCFPDIPSESITVAHCGVDPLFHPASESEINAFKYKYGVTKPYFLLVGTGSGYKNGILFFQAFAKLASSYGFDIICTGIGGVLTPELRTYTSGSAVHLVQLSDEELALAYSGAVALVYPSKYEGFGMPLLEAMACGCPVITCPNASIPEVTGEAAIYVNDDDVVALANALCEVQKPNIRQALITTGLAQSKNFSWTKMAEIVSSELINTTLLPLNLREINLIIFPDWSQPEDELGLELQEVIQTLATHPNSEKITLLINTGDIDTEDAEIFLSSVVMNILMEEEIDITEELTISLLIDLNEIQWQALLPCINARVSLEHENQKVIVNKQVEQIPLYSLENLKEVSAEQFFFQLGNSLFSQSKYQEAIIQYQKFQQIQIGNAEFYWSFSECFRQLNLLEQCFAVLQEGIKLYPVNAKLHFTVIVNYQMSGRVQEAITAANIALDNLPNNRTFQLISNLILPSVYDQVEEINAYRQRFKQGLDNLINNIPLNNIEDQQNTLIATSCWTNFYLPYQADNVLILQSQYGNWLHQIMKANYPQWGMPLLMPPLKENQKIRIGYASHYLHSYSGTLWLTGWLRYCDHNNFEIYCYYTGNQADAITEKFQEYSDFFYHIPDNLPAVCEQIIADKLHILVYPEIGMDAPTMQMAGLRLAPVQCAAWGHPVTTGLPTIDYFLSSELMEGQNAQEHYSEKLILLPNIGVSYPKPYIPSVIKTRSDYGLSDDDVIYLCCQAPFKYLPQYDFIVAEIASRVSQAKFVFLRGNVLKPRLQRAFAAVGLNSEDYCVHLNIPERLDYLMINLLSDVYLDTFTWSGGNTSLEAIACNLPIVTCPGEFMRGRHTDSFLKMIGVTDTIASNEQEYIEIAVRLGLDKPWRRSIAERMSQNHDCLFDDKACVTGLESFYKKVCSKHFSAS
ncbi:FkbM family methyltransferase [Aphanizomenon flos-aquae]|uniref:protein O-GlcNAc transferase n=1 Tax=Aphanizomenon flos-aquae FACHB-1040 TaxID=2692887 RepID=A0ABR8BUF9_APHFL|nr:FkbM family methyltransferase [Aphanizomenon flos-aquae]MBD2277690.1 FkbM family methyltransferase [Aphanizomenon flos-aquae FACHB-1040]